MVKCGWDKNGDKSGADYSQKRKHSDYRKDPEEARQMREGKELLGQVICEDQGVSMWVIVAAK